MKIVTYNVNGIRAAMRKGLNEWLNAVEADIVCLQEVKAELDQVDLSEIEAQGYHISWNSAVKKGYSGVAILSKSTPIAVEGETGYDYIDDEGRVIVNEFDNLIIVSVYMPSGSSGEERQQVKMKFLEDFKKWLKILEKKGKNVIVSGDFNICHKPIDIHNPIRNKNSPGFLPDERAWMDELFGNGYIDAFRSYNDNPGEYSWWSYMFNARKKNYGWRIDYHAISESLKPKITRVAHLKEAYHSDHCPVLLELDVDF